MPSTVPHTGPYDSDFDPVGYADDLELGGYDPDQQERSLGLLAHLAGYAGLLVPFGSLLGPALVLWIKRDESAFAEDQAREALNFQLSMILYSVVAALSMVLLVGFLLLPAVLVWWLVGTAIGATRASAGEWYRYPRIIRFLKG